MIHLDWASVRPALLLGASFVLTCAGWAGVDLYRHRNDFAARRL